MLKNLILPALGFVFGLLREFGCVNYNRGIIHINRKQGSLATLGIGAMDLFVLAVLALDRNLATPVAYLVGETIGTYLFIGKKNGQLQDRGI